MITDQSVGAESSYIEAEGVLEDLPSHPTRSSSYSSPTILARRSRILHETRKLIAEKGLEGFNVRELCRRADIAQRTLYNAFNSKERLIAIAIREAYDAANANIRFRTSADTLEGIVDRLISINTRNRGARLYARAIATLFFSPNVDEDIWRALQHMVFRNIKLWLARVAEDGELLPFLRQEELAIHVANTEYSIINDWAQGRISDEDYLPQIVRAVLCIAMGATRGKPHEQARKYLEDLDRTGKLPKFPNPGWHERRPST